MAIEEGVLVIATVNGLLLVTLAGTGVSTQKTSNKQTNKRTLRVHGSTKTITRALNIRRCLIFSFFPDLLVLSFRMFCLFSVIFGQDNLWWSYLPYILSIFHLRRASWDKLPENSEKPARQIFERSSSRIWESLSRIFFNIFFNETWFSGQIATKQMLRSMGYKTRLLVLSSSEALSITTHVVFACREMFRL